MINVKVRAAEPGDLVTIADMERQTWDPALVTYRLDEIPPFEVRFLGAHHYVAYDGADGAFVGFGIMQPYTGQRSTSHVGVLQLVGVLPQHRGRGFGKTIVRACLDASSHLGFERVLTYVMSDNLASLRMTQAAGFKEEGRLRGVSRRPSGDQDKIILAFDTGLGNGNQPSGLEAAVRPTSYSADSMRNEA